MIKVCIFRWVLLRAKKVGHQISVSFEKFDVVQALLSFFLTLFQLTV
jgi:predicted glycosyltransferase